MAQSHVGRLIRCYSCHPGMPLSCWVQFDGKHIDPSKCTCRFHPEEGWACPIDTHAQRWRNENPEWGRPFLPKSKPVLEVRYA